MYRILEKVNQPSDIKNLTKEQLIRLSAEIREFLLQSISKTGGHLSSNLGVVELSIALHRVFNSPVDKIIWDVGHQGYVHKILTGRRDDFDTLRQHNGMSGFSKRSESEHDQFEAGHSSTSISVAAGYSKAREIKGQNFEIVAVIGDGALTGGMAFEALNNLGHSKDKVIVVLNDNEMSISENVGGMSKYLENVRTTEAYRKLKIEAHNILDKLPKLGGRLSNTIKKFKGSVKYFFIPGMLFEDLGFTYIGPIDGNNLESLEEALIRAKSIDGPVLVHAITKKGKGYKLAEENPDLYHGVGAFNISKGVEQKNTNTFSDVFGNKILSLAKGDDKIVAVTAAMPSGTGLTKFKENFPGRYVDVGIAEQHAVTMCAAMAQQKLKPVFAVYSTFLQRAYDQIVHDVCIQNLPVLLCIDRAGIVGQDGETHHGVFDIAFLRHIPGIRLYAPKNGLELEKMLEVSLSKLDGPVAIRYPRGESDLLARYGDYLSGSLNSLNAPENVRKMLDDSIDTPEIVFESRKMDVNVMIIGAGNMVANSIEASQMLLARNIGVTVVNPRILSPLDFKAINSLVSGYDLIATVEDGNLLGGFGEYVASLVRDSGIQIINFGYPNTFIEHGDPMLLYRKYGIDSETIGNKIYETVEGRVNG